MPAVSERQRKFMGAELARLRAGKSTETGMSEKQLRDFARKPTKKRKKKRSHKGQSWEDGLRGHMMR